MEIILYKLTKKPIFIRIIYEFDLQNDTTFVLDDVTM
jgi:hypothetical protein